MAVARMPNRRVLEVRAAMLPQKRVPRNPKDWQLTIGPRIIRSLDGVLASTKALVLKTCFNPNAGVRRIARLSKGK